MGDLQVIVQSARNLVAADIGGSSDPYVTIRINATSGQENKESKEQVQTAKTKVVSK